MLLARERRVQERDDQVAGLEAQLNTRAAEIEHLKLWIAKLRRMQFGRKSEKLDHQIEQMELQLEDLQADEGEVAKAIADGGMPSTWIVKPFYVVEHVRT